MILAIWGNTALRQDSRIRVEQRSQNNNIGGGGEEHFGRDR